MELFNKLMSLVDDKYYYIDTESPYGTRIRIFKTEQPWSDNEDLNMFNGIGFVMDGQEAVSIAFRPLGVIKNATNEEYILDTDHYFYVNDGRIVCSYLEQGILRLSDNNGLLSPISQECSSLFFSYDTKALVERIIELEKAGYSCVFEYTSPSSSEYVYYYKETLRLVAVVEKITGHLVPIKEIIRDAVLRPYLNTIYSQKHDDYKAFYKELVNIKNIKGTYIFVNDNYEYVESKFLKNVKLIYEMVMDDKTLFEMIADRTISDAKTALTHPKTLDRIQSFQLAYGNYIANTVNQMTAIMREITGYQKDKFSLVAFEQSKAIGKPYLYQEFISLYDVKTPIDYFKIANRAFLANYKLYVPEK